MAVAARGIYVIRTWSGRALTLVANVAMTATLLGCSEAEVILPGTREVVPEIAAANADPDPNENRSVSISLPAQKANTSWPQGHGTAAYRTTHPALGQAPSLIWSANIGEGDDRRHRITATPVVGGGLIYTLDSRALVSAVSPSGAVVWSKDLTPARDNPNDATGGGVAYHDGTLYVSLGFGRLAALDAVTGAEFWVQNLTATGSGQPLVAGDIIYLVAGDSTGWAIDRKTGRIRWQIEGPPSISNVLGAPAPVLADDLVVFAFGSGDLAAAFRKGGLRRWGASVTGQRPGRSASSFGDVTGAPVVVGSRIYVGNAAGGTAAIDAGSGDRIWSAPYGALTPVWVAGGSVFTLTDSNQLVRLGAGNGEPIWAVDLPLYVKDTPLGRGPIYAHYGPVLAGGRVWVASSDGFLRAFSPQNGSLVQTIEIPGGATTDPIVVGQTLYVVGTKGQLHAFR